MKLKSSFGPSFREHLVITSNIWSLASIKGVTGETPMAKHGNFTDSRKIYFIYEMGGELCYEIYVYILNFKRPLLFSFTRGKFLGNP